MNPYKVCYCESCNKHCLSQAVKALKCKYCGKSILLYSKEKGTIHIKFITRDFKLAQEYVKKLNLPLMRKCKKVKGHIWL